MSVFAVFSWVTSRQRLNAIQSCRTCFLTLSLVKLYSAAKLHGVWWWLLVPPLVSPSQPSAQHLPFMMVIVLIGCQLTLSRYAITSVAADGRHSLQNAGNSIHVDSADCLWPLLCIKLWWKLQILKLVFFFIFIVLTENFPSEDWWFYDRAVF